jgi:hypothetical protein
MKKAAFLILLGSALVAFGFSGWHLDMRPSFTLDEPGGYQVRAWAGWTLANQIEITSGVVLLVWGVLMRLKIQIVCKDKT